MTYLNIDNMTVALGASMADEPFSNRTTAESLVNAIDAPSADAEETHSQPSHVWINSQPLELDFDFGAEYELEQFHFWNYHTEQYDVDHVHFEFYDIERNVVGTLSFTPDLGVGVVQSAQDYELNFPSRIQYVNAVFTGTNGEVDFNNIAFTGELGPEDPGGRNRIVGDGSDEIIEGTAFQDRILGRGGNDAIDGAEGSDIINGGRGDDRLFGGSGDDVLRGGAGFDTLDGGFGDDILDGGRHGATARYSDAPDRVLVDLAIEGAQDTGSQGNDTLINIRHVIGSEFGDELRGDDSSNSLYGRDGADLLNGRGGQDRLVGGGGDDTLNGGGGRDLLLGGTGDDSINGGAGRDRLTGGEGDDYLTGGSGRDVFIFNGEAGHDVISDFSTDLDDSIRFRDGSGLSSYLDFRQAAEDTADGVLVTLGPDSSILIADVMLDDLNRNDFNF